MDIDSTRRMADLEANMSIALGRLNAVHMLLVVMARQLPPDVAEQCAKHGRDAQARVEADALASPLPELMLNEMQRVMAEGIMLFDLAAKQPR